MAYVRGRIQKHAAIRQHRFDGVCFNNVCTLQSRFRIMKFTWTEDSKVCEIESLLQAAIAYLDDDKIAQAASNIGMALEILIRIEEKKEEDN